MGVRWRVGVRQTFRCQGLGAHACGLGNLRFQTYFTRVEHWMRDKSRTTRSAPPGHTAWLLWRRRRQPEVGAMPRNSHLTGGTRSVRTSGTSNIPHPPAGTRAHVRKAPPSQRPLCLFYDGCNVFGMNYSRPFPARGSSNQRPT